MRDSEEPYKSRTDLTMKRLMALSLGMALAVDAHLMPNKNTMPMSKRGRDKVNYLQILRCCRHYMYRVAFTYVSNCF